MHILLGETAVNRAWAIAKPHVNKALKDPKCYTYYINSDSGRYLGTVDKKSKKKQYLL